MAEGNSGRVRTMSESLSASELKGRRKPVRKQLTLQMNQAESLMKGKPLEIQKLKAVVDLLATYYGKLQKLNEQVCEAMALEEASEEDIDKEYEVQVDYDRRYFEVKVSAETKLNPEFAPRPTSPSNMSETTVAETVRRQRRQLPTVRTPSFSGKIDEWIGWWAQFKVFHEDGDTDTATKFVYLRQAIQQGSRAADLVDSYPPSEDNYEKVIKALTERFGNEEVLIEFYIRKLIKLIVESANDERGKQGNLTRMYDLIESHLRSLETLGVTTQEGAANFLFPMVESCLSVPVLRAWQHSPHRNDDKIGSKLQRLMKFIKDEVESEGRIELAHRGFAEELRNTTKQKSEARKNDSRSSRMGRDLPTAMGLMAMEDKGKCGFCSKSHQSTECRTAARWELGERRFKLKQNGRCYVCLQSGHLARECRISPVCERCGGKHYVLLCYHKETRLNDNSGTSEESHIGITTNATSKHKEEKIRTTSTTVNRSMPSVTLYPTMMVQVITRTTVMKVRAAIDTLSGHSYIRERVANELNLIQLDEVKMDHALFGGKIERKKHKVYAVEVKGVQGEFRTTLEVFGQTNISKGVPTIADASVLEELKEHRIYLSDVTVGASEIDLLIGGDVAGTLFTGRIIQLKSGPTAIETKLGWTVMGQNRNYLSNTYNCVNLSVGGNIVSNSMVNIQSPTVLWELETMGINDPVEKLTKQQMDEQTLEHFRKTVAKNDDGRYRVTLPWINGHPPLPNYYDCAARRLQTTTKKLKKIDMFKEYDDVFKEWIESGIIEEVSNEQVNKPATICYLPHRPVIKEKSVTTKVRPVFDASCNGSYHTTNARKPPSLNECLAKGPTLLERIPDLLLRFRMDRVGAIADIKKAFLMIEVDSRDRDALRFIWWTDETCTNLRILRHSRVVFGVNCSPFLLGAVIEHHLKNSPEQYSACVERLLESLYVDNVVTSFPNEKEYEEFRRTSVSLLKDAKFELRLWETNRELHQDSAISNVLGMKWERNTDVLYCETDYDSDDHNKVTKRALLATIARVFDPLGILAPITIVPKILFQKCWISGTKWDEPVDEDTRRKFINWVQDLRNLQRVQIDRCFFPPGTESSVHVFCDASENGYAAVAFHRIRIEGDIKVIFIMSKSRVTPLKKVTINRLELISCEIATRLGETIKGSLKWNHIPFYYWTDSTTARAWIQRGREWGTFVGNRVRKILDRTQPLQWRHVPGRENPADMPSRGCTIKELLRANWWSGPQWLRQEETDWPDIKVQDNEDDIMAELKRSVLACGNLEEDPWYSSKKCRLGSYSRIVRVRAWITRFMTTDKGKFRGGALSQEEVVEAERKLLRQIQREEKIDIQSFRLPCKVFADSDDLIRVQTKLTYREDDTDFKTPIVVPGNHYIAQLIIRETHWRNHHAGTQVLMGQLRERYSITGARRAIGKAISNCSICKRYRASHPIPTTAPLPENRVRDATPFEVTGVDYAGPLYLKGGKKTWIALYTCAIYRGIHLELVDSLSTESFLLSLRRFIARRGRPSVIYSDNGTNFTGANRQLRSLDWKKIERETLITPIKWIFFVPAAPWWGGFWERLVRSLKEMLFKILGQRVLGYEELVTVLCDVESVINSRPLSHVYEGDDLVPLTPAMFISGTREVGVPGLDQLDTTELKKKWAYRQRLIDDLRKRFQREYLGQLIERKRNESVVTIAEGDVVLLETDNAKRVMWPLGVVEELIRGRDGVIRAAKVKTAKGVWMRPIQRIYPLEMRTKEMEDFNDCTKTRRGRIRRKPLRLKDYS